MATMSLDTPDPLTHQTIPWIKTDNINKSSFINIPGLPEQLVKRHWEGPLIETVEWLTSWDLQDLFDNMPRFLQQQVGILSMTAKGHANDPTKFLQKLVKICINCPSISMPLMHVCWTWKPWPCDGLRLQYSHVSAALVNSRFYTSQIVRFKSSCSANKKTLKSKDT